MSSLPPASDDEVLALFRGKLCEVCGGPIVEHDNAIDVDVVQDVDSYDFDPKTGKDTGGIFHLPHGEPHIWHSRCGRPPRFYQHHVPELGHWG